MRVDVQGEGKDFYSKGCKLIELNRSVWTVYSLYEN